MTTTRLFPGWRMVGAGFVLQGLATAIVSYSYGLMLAPIAAEFGVGRLQMMLGITVSTLASGVLSPFLGIAMDRTPLRRMAMAGVVLLGVGLMLLSRVQAMWQVVAVYALCMAGAMTLTGPLLVSTLLARWFQRRRGAAMGVAALGTSVCGFLVPPLLQAGIEGIGWRGALATAGTLVLLLALPAATLVEDRPEARGLAPDGEEPRPAVAPPPASDSTLALLRAPAFWLVAFTLGVLFSVYSSLMSNLVPLSLGHGHAADAAALLMSAIAVCGMLGKLGFGVVADRVDLRLALSVAIVLVIAALLLFISQSAYAAVLAGSCLLGLAAGGMLPVWGTLMAVLFGAANYGRAMGLMNPVMMPLVVLGAPFAGWSFDRSGSYALAFAVFAGCLCLSLLALARLRLPAR